MDKSKRVEVFKSELSAQFDERELLQILRELEYYKVFERMTIDEVISKLKQHIPHQYLSGRCYFYDFDVYVNKYTLIPRPETEELVYLIVQQYALESPEILDIGTGSGCIALALAKHIPHSKVTALDVSAKALEIVNRNKNALKLDLQLWEQDVLQLQEMKNQFDVIVSNPPYIPHQEKSLMHRNVLDHEPHLALFVEDTDQLVFYKKIAALCDTGLKPNGTLYFECNEYNAKDVQSMLLTMGFANVIVHRDMQGKDRMISARK